MHCTTDHIHTCTCKSDNDGWIYIGEVKQGTDDIPHGIGIQLCMSEGILEGHWKDGYLHTGRFIRGGGWGYYIGEWEKDCWHGQGTLYYKNGEKEYEGGFKDGKFYGQGTWYTEDGDKYTGQWNDREGKGEINYIDGIKYTGEWYKSYRDGLGTLYSADGQVLNQGKWKDNKYVGKE